MKQISLEFPRYVNSTDNNWGEYTLRDSCRLCGSSELDEVLALQPTPLANDFLTQENLCDQAVYPLRLFWCEDCFHIQLLDVVAPETLFENYLYSSGTSQVFIKHFRDYAEYVDTHFPENEAHLVVDVGSNDGTLLQQFKDLGWDVLGIDPAKNLAVKANEKGLTTVVEFLSEEVAERIVKHSGKAAVVTANNVFAHCDDMLGFVKAVKTLMASDGLYFFEVSYFADVFQHLLFDTIYHEHLAYHTVAPLQKFFAANGMKLVDVQRVESHGGSLRGVVAHSSSDYSVKESVRSTIAHENQLGFNQTKVFGDFQHRIDELGRALREMLADIKAQGKTIAGFGAPAKATTLLYHFQLGAADIDFIVDDSSLKQHRFMPKSHIPILPSSALYDRRPDFALILAWNFADPIIANHKRFISNGGKFIVPVPELKIVN